MGHMTLTLLCLAAYILAVTPLEPDAVFRATTYINNNIFSGLQGEYAFFVKFTANECNGGLQEAALRTALRDISSRTVQNRLNSGHIYEGGRLVAAKPIVTGPYTDHAEYRLLYPTAYSEHNDSPIGWLLGDAADRLGCVIFYSALSPCIDQCANPDVKYNLKYGLESLRNLPSNRAFAFRYVYGPDRDQMKLFISWPSLNNAIPLYRCNNNNCRKCIDNNGAIDPVCHS
ncbi:uncharacterized protein [Engystomops pustulosus]|uniref:uncharacterized protein n=1 Tax=Engystomops pustulosus TaxID=76066 RepID=UPI003AFB1A8D